MSKRVFTQEEIDAAIQASATHCAYLLNGRRGENHWTTQMLIEDLRNGGGTWITPRDNSFSERGGALSISRRLGHLQDAIQGDPSSSFLHYWTRNAEQALRVGCNLNERTLEIIREYSHAR